MIRFTITIALIFLSASCFSQEKTDYSKLEKIDEVFYLKGTKKPFTGQCYSLYPSGKIGMGGKARRSRQSPRR